MSEFNPKGGKSVRRSDDGAGNRGKYGGRNKEYKGTGSPGTKKKSSKPNRPGKAARMQKRSTKR